MSSLRLRAPRAGWLGLGLLGVMLLSLGWSVQSAAWISGLEFIVPVLLLAGASGALLALTQVRTLIVVPVGALLGAGVVIWSVGGEYFAAHGQLDRLLSLREEAIAFALTVADAGYPGQISPYALAMGLVAWTTAFVAAYTLERHGHAFDAVLLVGAALVANMSATLVDLFSYLVLFVLAALLLLLRHGLAQREESWQQRRVTENGEVPGGILRTGVLFTAGTIAMAWILTSVAVAAPLTSAWRNLDVVWHDMADRMQTLVGGITTPEARLGGTHFQSTLRISGAWFSNDQTVMIVAADSPHYMRAVTYDHYTGRGWLRSDGSRRDVGPEQPVFPGETAERPITATEEDLETITVRLEQASGRSLFAPGYPIRAYVPVQVYETRGYPVLGGLEATSPISPGQGYQVTVVVNHATEAQLAEAGTIYPDHIRELYLPAEGVTDRTRELATQIVEAAGATDPYQKAKALAAWFQRDPSFSYNTRAALPSDPDQDFVDFFLFDPEGGRVGYCEYYASAMTVMLRSLGIPARLAVGFGPGERTGDGTFEVRERNAHAWTEAYFPGYGWQIFEPTKSINPRFTRPAGEPTGGSQAPPATGSDLNPLLDFESRSEMLGRHSQLRDDFEPLPGGFAAGTAPPPDATREGNALVLFGLLAIGAGLGFWTLRRSRRGIGRVAPGRRPWERLALAAERAGVSRRPTETMYEYAAWLSDQIPARRGEIHTIADGTVWQVYSGRRATGGMIAALERAWHRLRRPLLWLAIRRRLAGWLPSRRR